MFGRLSLIVVVAACAYIWSWHSGNYVYPEINYSVKELVESHGYPFEYHSVTTPDGYILELHRIPSKRDNGVGRKPPILIMHGLVGSSINYLTSGDKSFPYYLADRGYDVWLGNARGNTYSRKHTTLNPNTDAKQFFDFSWHEIGTIDLPAMIDYIREQTQYDRLLYVGHSQGCISFHAMLSELPAYNDKVELMLAFAPVVYTKAIRSYAFNVPAALQGFLEWLSEAIGYYEIMTRNRLWTNFGNTYCRDGAWTQRFCHIHLGLAGGFNEPRINKTLLPLIYAHVPAGSSAKQLFHYTQITNSDVFRQYDHGFAQNIRKYGQSTPPLYRLERTTVSVAMFYADNDWLTSERDIDVLHRSLPNVIHKYKVPDELFNHFDFLISINAIDILYPHVVDVIEKHLQVQSDNAINEIEKNEINSEKNNQRSRPS